MKSIFSVLLAGLAATAMAGVQCKNCGVATDNVIYRCRDGHIVCSKCMDDVHPVLGSGGTFGMLAFGSSAKMIGLCPHVNASDEKCGSPIFANSKIVADNRDSDEVAENRRRRVRPEQDADSEGMTLEEKIERHFSPEEGSTGDKIYSSVDAETILELMKKQGYNVRLDKDYDIKWNIDGIKCFIFFRDGKKRQSYFYFSCNFLIDKQSVPRMILACNEYNRKKVFGTCYINEKRDKVTYHLPLNLRKGVTEARIIDFFGNCEKNLKSWRKEIFAE